jgi:HlyD family secretion protein
MDRDNIKDKVNSENPFEGAGETIELRSEEVQEILTRPPHALIRYGISIICGVILLLFVGSFFFRYPDTIQGDVVITTENPPAWVVAKSTGKLKELFCTDKQKVQQGDILAVIDNPAATSDVLKIKELLSPVQITATNFYVPKELLMQSYELGEIQTDFSAFIKSAVSYENFLSFNLIHQEKQSLQMQLSHRGIYADNLRGQLEMKKKELTLAQSEYEREKKLYAQNVISESDMETAEQSYLNKQQEFQQLQTAISLGQVETSQLKGSANKLSVQYQQEKNQTLADLQSALRELITAIEKWQQTYLLIAPQGGIITFNSFWRQNQNISSGDKVFAIISHRPGQLIGKIKISSSGYGKIKLQQAVNIKLAGYPYLEYGLVQGKVSAISMVPNGDNYTVELSLTKGLCTTMKKELKFTGELTGTAEIITENHSLIERLITPLKYLVTKNGSNS